MPRESGFGVSSSWSKLSVESQASSPVPISHDSDNLGHVKVIPIVGSAVNFYCSVISQLAFYYTKSPRVNGDYFILIGNKCISDKIIGHIWIYAIGDMKVTDGQEEGTIKQIMSL